MAKIGIIYSDKYLEHDTGGHVEGSSRAASIRKALMGQSWSDELIWMTPREATPKEIAYIHGEEYIDYIGRFCSGIQGIRYLNPDTAVCPESYKVALLAAGGVLCGIDGLMSGEIDGFFAVVRPPGHHAEFENPLGFCVFNNIAIGARYALDKYDVERIFIFDWDIHHGNGTQHSLENDPNVFFCSFHQSPHYPGTGARSEMGKEDGYGYTLNLPMRAGCKDDDYMYLMREVVEPAVKKFKPQLMLISAGFDAHKSDPLGGIKLSEECFGAMLKSLLNAAGGECKAGLVLEGGYNLTSLSASSANVIGVFTGNLEAETYSEIAPSQYSKDLASYHLAEHPFLKK